MLFQYWSTVDNTGPTIQQHWVEASCLPRYDAAHRWRLFVSNVEMRGRLKESMTMMTGPQGLIMPPVMKVACYDRRYAAIYEMSVKTSCRLQRYSFSTGNQNDKTLYAMTVYIAICSRIQYTCKTHLYDCILR